MIHDQHVHSYYSFDSDQPIEEYLEKANKLGLKYFVLTDHYDMNHINSGKDLSFDISKQRDELDKLQKRYPNVKILYGIEMGYKPSELKRINKILNDNEFDIINLSLHELEDIDYYFKDRFIKDGIDNTLKTYFSKQLEMVRSFDHFDVLCHVDYAFKTAYLIDNNLKINRYENTIIEIMKELIKKDKALEINTKVQEIMPIEHTQYLLELYKRVGGKNLTLSSDAHEAARFCDGFDKYVPIVKESGFNHLTYFIKRKKYLFDI